MKRLLSKKATIISTIIWIVLIVALWEYIAYDLEIVAKDPMYLQKLPSLFDIFSNIMTNLSSLFQAGIITTSRAMYGLLLGGIIGYVVALILSFSKVLEKMIFPHLIVFQMIPVLALAPIVYTILKDQDVARITLSAFITFFPVVINVHAGLTEIEPEKRKLLFSYAAGKYELICKLLIPASLPSLFTGLKLATPAAITAGILVEMLGADNGIGIKIISGIYYGSDGALAFWGAVLVAGFLGMIGYSVIIIAEKILIPWSKREEE